MFLLQLGETLRTLSLQRQARLESLDTDKLTVAQLRLADLLKQHRQQQEEIRSGK
ncbi:MAG TPA: hypothetical protein VFA77_06900 [Candidatus Eisenbacteria bacterium]|jgi:hypothetical protein|nr:hypothetical protein [Candidatus Eisenbacteria bacterium]